MSAAWAGGSTRAHRRWRAAVLERDGWVCQVRLKCEGAPATHADHVVPLAGGGDPLDLANGRASCAPCNTSRGAAGYRAPAGAPAGARVRQAVRTWAW